MKLTFLQNVGLEYLTLDRYGKTLSGGEFQRINLSNQLASLLTGTLYVLDEPTIGLHPCDTDRLLALLRRLADQGNTVLAVEHDTAAMRAADWLVELGPAAGERGVRPIGDWSTSTAPLSASRPVMRFTRPTTSPRCSLAECLPSKWRSSWRWITSVTSVDFPEPETPVTTHSVPTGIATVRSARLWALAPSMVIQRGPARRRTDGTAMAFSPER